MIEAILTYAFWAALTSVAVSPFLALWWLVYRHWIRGADPRVVKTMKYAALAAGLGNGLLPMAFIIVEVGTSEIDTALAIGVWLGTMASLLGACLGKMWSKEKWGLFPSNLARGLVSAFAIMLLLMVPGITGPALYFDGSSWLRERPYRYYFSLALTPETAAAHYRDLVNKRPNYYELTGLLLNPTLPESNQLEWAGKLRGVDFFLLKRRDLPRSVAEKIARLGDSSVRNQALKRLRQLENAAPAQEKSPRRFPASKIK